MASGRVLFVSGNGGMVVVKHDDGYALIELLGDEGSLAIGDVCSADWDAVGGEQIRAGNDSYDAYFQGSWGAAEIPIRMAIECGGAPH